MMGGAVTKLSYDWTFDASQLRWGLRIAGVQATIAGAGIKTDKNKYLKLFFLYG